MTQPISGHVFRAERKRGPVWYAKYRLGDGRQVQKKIGPAWTGRGRPSAGYFTKRTAQAWLDDLLAQARRGELAVSTGATVADAAAEWLRWAEDDRACKPSTLTDYGLTARRITRDLGELLALQWRDIDFAGHAIRVRQSHNVHGGLGTPKSGKVRSVPLVPEVARALADLADRPFFTGDEDLVFPGETGGFLDASALRDRYKAALEEAGLRRLRFHDLRHTFGTLAVRKAEIPAVQAWMGTRMSRRRCATSITATGATGRGYSPRPSRSGSWRRQMVCARSHSAGRRSFSLLDRTVAGGRGSIIRGPRRPSGPGRHGATLWSCSAPPSSRSRHVRVRVRTSPTWCRRQVAR